MYEELLLEWNLWWKNNFQRNFKKRDKLEEIKKNLDNDLIISLIGIRRSGKTQLLYETINYLIKTGVDKHACFFIKIDDLRIKDKLNLNLIYKLIEEREILFGKTEKLYLFFDEIQEMNNWQQALKTLYDLNKSKYKIIITGSNASLLKEELSDYLTGRKIDLEVYPFSFKEYLNANININLDNKIEILENKVKIKRIFLNYLNGSSFPEINFDKVNRVDYLKNLHETIVLKDVVLRYKLTNSSKILDVSRYIITNSTKPFNYLKISSNLEISKDSFSLYINYFENVFLFFKIYLYDYSLKKQQINEKKIYVIDQGFLNFLAFKFSEDKGRLLENLVFIELKRRGKEIYYHKQKKECDFVIKEGLGIVQAIQVTQSLEDIDTKKREIAGLLDACSAYKLKTGLILTQDEEDEFEQDGVKIQVMPIWKWLLVEN